MPDIIKQGDSYEEKTDDVMLSDESTSSKMPPMKVIVLGIIVVFIILTTVGYLYKADKGKEKKDTSSIESSSILFTYTAQEREQLRSYGYSGEEIDNAELSCELSEDLINKVITDRKENMQRQYMELYDAAKVTGSKEFMELLDDTWLNGPVRDVKPGKSNQLVTVAHKENVNYKKLVPHGNQLYIKITLNNGTSAFMEMNPARYQEIGDAGNMVISYSECCWQDESFITDIREIPLD